MASSELSVREYLIKEGMKDPDNVLAKLKEHGVDEPVQLRFLEEKDLEGLPTVVKRHLVEICDKVKRQYSDTMKPSPTLGQQPPNIHPHIYPPYGYYQGHGYSHPLTQPAASFFPLPEGHASTRYSSNSSYSPHPYYSMNQPLPTPPPITVAPLPVTQQYTMPAATAKAKFKLRYILCDELFTTYKEEKFIAALDPLKDTMENFINIIHATEHVRESVQVELFSEDGHPLNINPFTIKFTLNQWKIQNDDGFYAFLRRKQQPAWEFEELDHNTSVDPNEGSLSVKVVCQAFGTFSISINERKDDINKVAKKISKCINLSEKLFELHSKINDYEVMKTLDNVKKDKLIIVRLKPPNLLRNYGKSSYIPMTEQTEKGIAKFYSILRYVTESQEEDNRAIVAAVMKLTDCLPLATALHQLFNLKVISHVSQLVALFEGFYCLSRAILEYFFEINLDQTFEFFDYIFGLILNEATKTQESELLHFESIWLRCPITNRKMIQPVLAGQTTETTYEYLAAKEKLDEKEALPDCLQSDITVDDLLPNETMEHQIIANSLSSLPEVLVLERNYNVGYLRHTILQIPGDWKSIAQSVSYIKVMKPSELSDSLQRKNVLTYINDGYFAYAADFKKDTDLTKVIYNPLTCEEESYTSEQLKGFVCEDSTKVTHNIIQFLNSKVRASSTDIYDSKVVTQEKKDITREPKEAIMVLIDTSGSMNQPIFKEQSGLSKDTIYTRMRAAKDFFAAFANRTQAYEFHHVIGVICFDTEVKVPLPISEGIEQFKTVLETVHVTGSLTALYKAMNKAAELLSEFGEKYPNCKKRILCLTDGGDNASQITAYDVAQVLQEKEIVVDTVLINISGYPMQKAICHSTGGMCFRPESVSEGLRLFETESLLSIRQRQEIKKIELENEGELTKLKDGDYDSTDPYSFHSRLFLDLQKTTTCSAKRMVLLASFASEDIGASGQKPHVKQILTEIRKYTKNPHSEIQIFPDDSNVCNWKILLKGPAGTPYQNGVYLLFAKFPENYPYKPPEIRFVTPIYHCNINSMGRICHPILGRNYVPSLSMRDIFDQVYGLLMAPEADDPLDSILAEQYHTNKDEYYRKAQALNREKACQISWEEYIKTLTSDEDTDISEELTCPLTGHLYTDPVSTPYGHVYERDAIIKCMARNGGLDPKARKPLKINDLRPDRATKALADKFRKINIV